MQIRASTKPRPETEPGPIVDDVRLRRELRLWTQRAAEVVPDLP